MEIYEIKLIYKGIETIYGDLDIPSGMESFDLNFVRSKKYFSVFESFSFPFSFVYDAKDYVDSIKDADGINAVCEIYIYQRNEESLAFELLVNGVLDFKQYHFYSDYTDVPMVKSTKSSKFIERDSINYQLNSETSTDNVSITPFVNSPIDCEYTATDILLWAILSSCSVTDDDTGGNRIINDKTFISQLGNITQNVIGDDSVFASPTNDKVYVNNSGETKNIRFVFDVDSIVSGYIIPFTDQGTGNTSGIFQLTFDIFSYDSVGTLIDTDTIDEYQVSTQSAGTLPLSYTNTDSFVFNSTVPTGGYIEVYAELAMVCDSYDYDVSFVLSNYQIYEYISSVQSSAVESMFVHEAATRIVQLATSETDTSKLLRSEILGKQDTEFQTYTSVGEWSKLSITNGTNLRGLNRTLNMSFSELWSTINAIGNLGLWYNSINDIFEIKEKKDYYQDIQIIDFGEVNDFEITPVLDEYANSITGGYPSNDSEENINGLLAFNSVAESTTPIITKNTLNIQSEFGADTIRITKARGVQYEIQSQSDSYDFDNDNFIVYMNQIELSVGGNIIYSYVTETGSDFHRISGAINSDQYYNYRITPKRNLIRNSSIISPSFWKMIDSYIQPVFTRNDIDLKTQLLSTDPVISELDAEIVNPTTGKSNILNPLYDNDLYTFTAPITQSMIKQLFNNPHGYCRCVDNGVEYFGFIDELSTNTFERTGNVKLIRKPD